MNLLAVDTSGPVAGVAVLRGGEVAFEGASMGHQKHSQSLMPLVEEGLTHAGMDINQMDLFAVVTGPGSFTGVRIGVSTIKGMAHGAGKPCIGIDGLEALAAGIPMREALLCPILDARAGQVYGAAFMAGMPPERRMDNAAMKLTEYVKRVQELAGVDMPLCFMGDGVPAARETLGELLGERALLMPPHLSFLRPASVAVLGAHYADRAGDYLALQPQYLRAPQAERERAARLRKDGQA